MSATQGLDSTTSPVTSAGAGGPTFFQNSVATAQAAAIYGATMVGAMAANGSLFHPEQPTDPGDEAANVALQAAHDRFEQSIWDQTGGQYACPASVILL